MSHIVPGKLEDINSFLLETFDQFWGYAPGQLNSARRNLIPEMVLPQNMNWDQRKRDIDPSKSGQYTLNPETQDIDFENARVFIPDCGDLQDLSISKVAEYVNNTYAGRFLIPGIEYLRFISRNPSKAPQEKYISRWYVYFGSILRYQDGEWCVPCLGWASSSLLDRGGFRLGLYWRYGARVVLLEK